MKLLISAIFFLSFITCYSQQRLWKVVEDRKDEEGFYFGGMISDSQKAYAVFSHRPLGETKLSYSLSRTTDAGFTWSIIGSWTPNAQNVGSTFPISVAAFEDSIFYLGCLATGIVNKSTDGGKSWKMVYSNPPEKKSHIRYLSMLNKNNGVLICDDREVAQTAYYSTTDGWETWNKLVPPENFTFPLGYDSRSYRYAFLDILDSNILVARVSVNDFARSTDNGKTWSVDSNVIKADVPRKQLGSHSYSFINAKVGYAFAREYTQPGTTVQRCFMSKTTDGGVTWNNISEGRIPESYAGSSNPKLEMWNDMEGVIYAPLVSRTTDGGKSWVKDTVESIANQWPEVGVGLRNKTGKPSYVMLSDNKILKDYGVFTIKDLVEHGRAINATISPNPARERALLSMEANGGGGVVFLYNTLGQEVQHIEFGNETNVSLDLSGLTTGCYNAIIKTKRGVAVKKIIVN